MSKESNTIEQTSSTDNPYPEPGNADDRSVQEKIKCLWHKFPDMTAFLGVFLGVCLAMGCLVSPLYFVVHPVFLIIVIKQKFWTKRKWSWAEWVTLAITLLILSVVSGFLMLKPAIVTGILYAINSDGEQAPLINQKVVLVPGNNRFATKEDTTNKTGSFSIEVPDRFPKQICLKFQGIAIEKNILMGEHLDLLVGKYTRSLRVLSPEESNIFIEIKEVWKQCKNLPAGVWLLTLVVAAAIVVIIYLFRTNRTN